MLSLPVLFSSGMVVQRDAPVRIWGRAAPGAAVRVSLDGETRDARADGEGRWALALSPRAAGGPWTLTVASGDETVLVRDVLAGDVWLCSGQSNMQLPMRRIKYACPDELRAADPLVRQFTVPIEYDFHAPRGDLPGGAWQALSPDTVPEFSGVGYFFAKALRARYGVPVGLILSAAGGTPLEAWMSREALAPWPEEWAAADRWRDDDAVAQQIAHDQQAEADWYAQLDAADPGLTERWYDPGYDDDAWADTALTDCAALRDCGSVWLRREVYVPEAWAGKPARLFLGCVVNGDQTYVNGHLVGGVSYRYPPRDYALSGADGALVPGRNVIAMRVLSLVGAGRFVAGKPHKLLWDGFDIDLEDGWKVRRAAVCGSAPSSVPFIYVPTGLYNAMIAPLAPWALKGALWYQGESNTNRPEGYFQRFSAMVSGWRALWGRADLPVLTVQLANYQDDENAGQDWPELREQQRRALSLPGIGLAVAADVGEGNDLHPLNKKAVGDRLARWAARLAYGEDIVASGPLFDGLESLGDKAVLRFRAADGLGTRDGAPLGGFTARGPSGPFYPASAEIHGDTVRVSCPAAQPIRAVRYAWKNDPHDANLINSAGLPAVPFDADTPITYHPDIQ
jgi:sialate O-acetylesterase